MKYNSSQLIADYTVLAEAAYSDFSRLIYQEAESSPEKFEREEHDAIMYEDPETKEKLSDRPQAFARYVTSRYDVVAHWKDRGKLFIPAERNQSSGFPPPCSGRWKRMKMEIIQSQPTDMYWPCAGRLTEKIF